MHRMPLGRVQQGIQAYRRAADDLAYARCQFPGHAICRELEALVAQGHHLIYRGTVRKRGGLIETFKTQFPVEVFRHRKLIIRASLIFLVGVMIGAAVALEDPSVERFFLSDSMQSALEGGSLWTEGLTRVSPQASMRIATNNISVTFLAWVLGVTFGLGTVVLLFFNGLMLGVLAVATLRFGMLGDLLSFIVSHGILELPAIFIAGGAGLALGAALAFPKRYRRADEMRIAARRGVVLIVGCLPVLLIAGLIEAFVSPSSLPDFAKVLVAMSAGIVFVAYVLAGIRRAETNVLDA